MNFMAIIRSLEEFVYEVVTWLVFYPRMFLGVLLAPLRTMDYARSEFEKAPDNRYDALLSPLLFLLLSLLISHLLEIVTPGASRPDNAPIFAEGPLRSDFNLVIFRTVMFAVFPLLFALHDTVAGGGGLGRRSLEGPFYIQCAPAAVYALALGAAALTPRVLPGGALLALGLIALVNLWYLAVQIAWQRHRGAGWPRATAVALGGLALGWSALFAVSALLVLT